MSNKYCNLPGADKISETFHRINDGFGLVEADIDELQSQINNHINSYPAHNAENIVFESERPTLIGIDDTKEAIETIDQRVDNLVNNPDPNKDLELVDLRNSNIYGVFPTAKARLDYIDNLFSSHLAEKAYIINVLGEGAKGDGDTDDTEAIITAVAKAALFKAAGYNVTLHFPPCKGFKTTQSIVVEDEMNILMDAPIIYTGTGTALRIGKAVAGYYSNKKLKLNVVSPRDQQIHPDWTNDNHIGVDLWNMAYCNIFISAIGFTIGARCSGEGYGFAYNIITIGHLYQNKISLKLTNRNNGWINENLWLNGSFAVASTTNTDKERYGVVITSDDGLCKNNNGNLFIKPSFELYGSTTVDPAYALPILIEHGTNNEFVSCRNESNTKATFPYFARLQNDSMHNKIDVGYTADNVEIDDQTGTGLYTLTVRMNPTLNNYNLIFNSGNIPDLVTDYDTANYHVQNLNFGVWSNSTVYATIDKALITLEDDYVELKTGAYIGIFVDTTIQKKFFFQSNTIPNYSGRPYIVCYDESNNILSADNIYFYGKTAVTALGGAARPGADSASLTFKVSDLVKKIRVMVGGGTTTARIKSMSIYAIGGTTTAYSGIHDLRGSVVWDVGSLANGAGETSAPITVTGATFGDYVLVSAPVDLQGICCNGYVSAPNTVKIRVQNGTGRTVDLGSGTWKVKVIKA